MPEIKGLTFLKEILTIGKIEKSFGRSKASWETKIINNIAKSPKVKAFEIKTDGCRKYRKW